MYCTRDNSICSGAAPHSLPAAGLRLDQGTCTYSKFNVENEFVSNVLITYNVECFNLITYNVEYFNLITYNVESLNDI